MDNILYTNSVTDVRLKEMVEIIPSKDKELLNLIILTILSAGAGVGTPIFNKEPSEIGTKFILDDKEITSDDFLVVSISNSGGSYNFFGLLFEDANSHILKISLINPSIPNFQQITTGKLGCNANSITSAIISSSITEIEEFAFTMCSNLTSVTIGNSIASIGDHAFYNCSGLTSVTIPNSVTSIGGYAFYGCTGLSSIISLARIAPEIQSVTFQNIESGGTLHVPAGSNYSTWMSTSNYYLGKYSWTKVEDA